MTRSLVAALVFGLLATGPGPSRAQTPDADWVTLRTARYRIHAPAPAAPWARHLAARLEGIRDQVSSVVGWDDDATIDVLVADPLARPNGFAWAWRRAPRIVLWTSPPEVGSLLADFDDWPELIAIHEQTHLSHLLRPPRDRWRRLLLRLLPMPTTARTTPRWAIEGYATLVEGRLTGRGRPASDLRSALLRTFGLEGRLPSYAELSESRDHWLGRGMAYLAGSAFLEWLSDREGRDALPALWRRITAKQRRDFSSAFDGVFGAEPAPLWNRFRAELTWSTVEWRRRREGALREGEPWLETGWTSHSPAVSPDGARLAVVLGREDLPPILAVFPVGDDAEARRRWREEIDETLAADPEDVAPRPPLPWPREPEASLVLPGGGPSPRPRWTPDGELLFARALPDRRGRLRSDLFLWAPGEARARRLTHQADLRSPDPFPDGERAVAVRSRWGLTELVAVDLGDGSVAPLGVDEPTAEEVIDTPRISPAGDRLAFALHREGRWRLVLAPLVDPGAGRELSLLPGSTLLSAPAWRGDGSHLYASLGRGGAVDVHALPVAPSAVGHQVTRVSFLALDPAPSPDGKTLYFTVPTPSGFEVRRLALDAATDQVEALPTAVGDELALVLPAAPAGVPELAPTPVDDERPYGAGRAATSWSVVPVAHGGPAGFAGGIVGTVGDPVGRWTLFGAATGGGAPLSGVSLTAAWRGWRPRLEASIWRVEESPSRQEEKTPAADGGAFDLHRRGGSLGLGWRRHLPRGEVALRGRAGGEEIDGESGRVTRRFAGLGVEAETRRRGRRWRLDLRTLLRAEAGDTGGGEWRRWSVDGALSAASPDARFELRLLRREVDDASHPADRLRLGGPGSRLHPAAIESGTVSDPALPAATLVADAIDGIRARLDLGGPVAVVGRAYRVPGDPWLALAGIEATVATPPVALLALPGAELRCGAARIFDPPLEDETTLWLLLAWRP